MALFTVNNVKITGLSACVPKYEESNWDYDALTEIEKKNINKNNRNRKT